MRPGPFSFGIVSTVFALSAQAQTPPPAAPPASATTTPAAPPVAPAAPPTTTAPAAPGTVTTTPPATTAAPAEEPVAPVEPTPAEPAPAEPPPEVAPEPAPAAPAPPVAEEPAPAAASLPSDTRSGHFVLGLRGGFAIPFGEASKGVDVYPLADVGFSAGADVGIGISRHVEIGLNGEMQLHGDASQCIGCSSSGLAVGAFVRYHLVQGLRFDPWLAVGLGYRGLQVERPSGSDLDYAGLEWLRIQFGGDWYGFSRLGIGPFLDLGATSFLDVPAGEDRGGVNWRFQSGLRIVLDHPGK